MNATRRARPAATDTPAGAEAPSLEPPRARKRAPAKRAAASASTVTANETLPSATPAIAATDAPGASAAPAKRRSSAKKSTAGKAATPATGAGVPAAELASATTVDGPAPDVDTPAAPAAHPEPTLPAETAPATDGLARVEGVAPAPAERHQRIAIAAYLRYLDRQAHGRPGSAEQDWLGAEAEIDPAPPGSLD